MGRVFAHADAPVFRTMDAIRTALEYARGEYILIQDSDLEYDPQDYPALLRPLQQRQANVVYGVRPDRPERGLRFFL